MIPTALTGSHVLEDASAAICVKYEADRDCMEGAGVTTSQNPRILSRNFSTCTGLLIENIDKGTASLLHFFPGYVTQGQISELERLKAEGDHYRAVFVRGQMCHDSPFQNGIMLAPASHGILDQSLFKLVDAYIPDAQWNMPITLPHDGWSMGYDAETRHLHIENLDARLVDRTAREYYDYGDPYACTPILAYAPTPQVEKADAEINPALKRPTERGA